MAEQQIDYGYAEALGISHEAYDEVLDIVGHIPTIDELSTLLAMWESNGRQQSLYGWLRGQRHVVERNDYLYDGTADHRAVKEPRVKECLAIARTLCGSEFGVRSSDTPFPKSNYQLSTINYQLSTSHSPLSTGQLLYMVGNVSTEFANGKYARRCLHLVDEPMATGGHDEDCQYIEMILSALHDASLTVADSRVADGGLFGSLLRWTAPMGYDILAPREVRLDAFLFGEEPGRYLTAVEEHNDDAFLLKMDEARLNCCFLGRVTKNRIMVDGFDFGPVRDYVH